MCIERIVALSTDTIIEEKRLATAPNSTLAASNTGAGTPVVCLAGCLAQPQEAFPELECRRSINKADKVLAAQLSRASYLALGQIVSARCDTAGKPSVSKSDPSCHAFPLGRWLSNNTDVTW